MRFSILPTCLRFACCGLLSFSVSPAAAALAQVEGAPEPELALVTQTLERELEQLLEASGIPSISLALIREGEVVWATAHGYANVGARVPATTDTYYSTGSTFKFVTATAVVQLVEQGRLTLDTPLNQLVGPGLAIEDADDVTVRHLLSHHSGLDAFRFARRINPGGPVSTVPLWSRREHISPEEVLSHTRRTGPPGVEFEYSNDGYAILGFLVEELSRQSFDRHVATHVLQPLGVDIELPSVPSPRVVEHLALPYELEGGTAVPVAQVRYDGFAAGDVYLKATDMARFVAAHLNGGEYGGERILSASSAAEMRRPQFAGAAYGLGVRLASEGEHELIHHTGSIPGFNSIFVAEPTSRQGVYIMANAYGADRELGGLARRAMQLMWGEPGAAHGGHPARPEAQLSSELFDAYVGEYAFSSSRSFTVSRAEQRFFVQPTGQEPLEVFAASDVDFFLRRGQATLTFGRDVAGGPVTHLVLHKTDGDRRADRVR